MSKDTYYFSHDANARNDEKILMLRADHGWQGYGVYWALLEMMFESSDTKLFHGKTKGIAISYNIDITVLNDVINTCITESLFVSDGEKFWSESLLKRKGKFLDLKEKKSAAGKKGMQKRWANKGIDNTVITDDNKVITENNKGKESKVKESKEDIKDIIPFAEIIEYLNAAAGTKYKASGKKTQDFIKARWNEKFEVGDFKTVIDKKVAEWQGSDMAKFLRPETLFGTKFESYLNQVGGAPNEPNAGNFKPAQRTNGRQYDIKPPTIDWEQR